MTHEPQTLTTENVVEIHETLVRDFANSKDPVSPPGLREDGQLLESAVFRQHVGYLRDLKYPLPIKNAATLTYGITSNHPFFNGNKRTALVALLCHLDKNGLTFTNDVSQNDLYRFMKRIAQHYFAPKRAKGDASDHEVEEISKWIANRVRRIKKGERVVTFREFEKILKNYDIELENKRNNYVDVIKYKFKRPSLFKRKKWIGTRVAHIPYPREGMEVGNKVLKSVREACGLSERDGYDTEMFYAAETAIDRFIVKYRQTLNRLAKT